MRMDETQFWLVTIIGPLILFGLLVWLVMNRRNTHVSDRTEQGTRDIYADEEQRRREGTDDL
jgi:hypothetical protein